MLKFFDILAYIHWHWVPLARILLIKRFAHQSRRQKLSTMVYAQWGVRRSMCTRCRAPRWTWRGRCRACWGSHHCPSHRSSQLPARARLKKANCQFDQIRIINPPQFDENFCTIFTDYEAAPVLVHWERNGNDKKNNLMMSLHKKQMREERGKDEEKGDSSERASNDCCKNNRKWPKPRLSHNFVSNISVNHRSSNNSDVGAFITGCQQRRGEGTE